MLKRSFNYPQYTAIRSYDSKVKKCDMYKLLDFPEKTVIDMQKKIIQDEKHYQNTCDWIERHIFKR